MTFPSNISACAIAVSTLVSTAAFANDSFRQHDAHVHGVVELNIAQDGNDLLLEITAPGSDIVGFEHAPQTQEQTQAIQQAMSTLKETASLFEINSDANCELTDSYVNQSLSKQSDDDDHDHNNHDDCCGRGHHRHSVWREID
ncbi:ZrgA family zinc uptake protein [Photobacterium profundum]|uniref:ZrgA family zinc uptake protein n=1 Tax=Photobacterium profundum TaxID=74109 RepID=UPI003D0F69A0